MAREDTELSAPTLPGKPSPSPDKVFVLVVEEPEELVGEEWEIEGKGILGRKKECTIVVPDRTVSRQHLFYEPDFSRGTLKVRDLDSTNGTVIISRDGSERVKEGELKAGDRLVLGRVVLRFEVRTLKEHLKKKQINRMAKEDPLTSLATRRVFEMTLSQLCRGEQTFCVVFIDIDNLKHINDTWGHDEGDRTIKAVAKAIKSSIRQSDIAARYGGDEIVIILLTQKIFVPQVMERIYKNLEGIAKQMKLKTSPSFSWGVAEFPTDGKTPAELLKVADLKLYSMKAKAKKRAVR